jgi:DNA polymerase-3 subunit gamma/tau
MEQDYASLTERMDELEHRLESGAVASPMPGAGAAAETPAAAPKEKPQLPRAIPDDIRELIRNWKSIISETGGISRQYLNKGVPTLGGGGELLLVFDDPNAYSYLNEDKAGCITMLEARIAERTGKEIEVALRLNESGRRAGDIVPDLRSLINFDIEEEDF